MLDEVPGLRSFASAAKDVFDFAVVCGMGGSSLAPDIIADTFGRIDGFPQLYVLDSTCPQQIKELEGKIDIASTLFIISSKSGTTTEPNAFYAYFYEKVSKEIGAASAGRNFAAITDPGTKLDKEAQDMDFRADFENDPNIGGRYSALSFVGIAPSATAGYDINLLLDRALGAMHANDRSVDPRTAPGVRFGAAIGGLARNGRDKLTIVTHPAVKAFGAWAEQLIAESTGKMGKGIVPIEGEALGVPDDYGDDRVFVYVGANLPSPAAETDDKLRALEAAGHPVIRLDMNDAYDVGEQFYLWEIAVAAAGVILGIDAFDQPNVQESKDNTVALLQQYAKNGSFDEPKANVDGPAFNVTYLSGSTGHLRADADAGARRALRAAASPRLQRDHGLHRPQRNARSPARRAATEDSRRAPGRNDRRFRTALPAFDRAAAQGRPGYVRRAADHRRRSRRSDDPRNERRIPNAARGASAGRLDVAR